MLNNSTELDDVWEDFTVCDMWGDTIEDVDGDDMLYVGDSIDFQFDECIKKKRKKYVRKKPYKKRGKYKKKKEPRILFLKRMFLNNTSNIYSNSLQILSLLGFHIKEPSFVILNGGSMDDLELCICCNRHAFLGRFDLANLWLKLSECFKKSIINKFYTKCPVGEDDVDQSSLMLIRLNSISSSIC